MTNKIYLKNIKLFNLKHNNTYTYSDSIIDGRIDIYCEIHGKFNQRIDVHKSGSGCPECSKLKRTDTLTTFINKAIKKHKYKYNYEEVKYFNSSTKIKILCNTCNFIFNQRPSDHLSGSGCPKCANKLKTKVEHIDDFKRKHIDKYNYSKVEYKNNSTKIEIICPEHGSFWQEPHNHKSGSGCSDCTESKGEKRIRNYLEDIINIKSQYIFRTLDRYKFDFYIPSINLAIEYDGIQHFKAIDFFGGEEAFIKTQERDRIKNQYCKDNNINLLRIPYYNIDLIEELIHEELEYVFSQ